MNILHSLSIFRVFSVLVNHTQETASQIKEVPQCFISQQTDSISQPMRPVMLQNKNGVRGVKQNQSYENYGHPPSLLSPIPSTVITTTHLHKIEIMGAVLDFKWLTKGAI